MDEPRRGWDRSGGPASSAEDRKWRAVVDRDAEHDGSFVYAVTSTGIYCNPSCASRKPRRDRVRYYETPKVAEAHGFRACKRCRPNSSGPPPIDRMIELVRRYITEHLDQPLTLDSLADTVGLSPTHLHRTFTRSVGLTPKEFQDALRMDRFKGEVRRGRTVSRATFEAGFGSSRAVYDKAEQALGMTPGAYRRGGEGTAIGFRTAETPVGVLLLAATEKGVCFVTLGDSEEEVENLLRVEYRRARIHRDDGTLSRWTEAIVSELNGDPPQTDVPCELVGTEFQKRVWRAIRSIPRGETRSYGEVAESMGQPGAARAVAAACGANRIALIVPCHRVVRANGDPGGYRWGRERKEQILRLEASPGLGKEDPSRPEE